MEALRDLLSRLAEKYNLPTNGAEISPVCRHVLRVKRDNRESIVFCEICGEEIERIQTPQDLIIARKEAAEKLSSWSGRTFRNWRDRTDVTPEERESLQQAYIAAAQYVRDFEDHLKAGTGMLLWGPNGAGKSHLAEAIGAELKIRYVVVYLKQDRYFEAIQACLDNEASETELMNLLRVADLVILDDLCVTQLTTAKKIRIASLIEKRYQPNRPLIITTNYDLVELRDRITVPGDSPAAWSRILELCGGLKVYVNARDMRPLLAKEGRYRNA